MEEIKPEEKPVETQAVEVKEEKKEVETKPVLENVPQAVSLGGLLSTIHQTLEDARRLIVLYNEKHKKLDEGLAQVDSRTNMLNVLKESLAARESNCERIENIEDLHKKALGMEKEYSEKLNGVQEAINHHNREVTNWKNLLKEQREEAQRETQAAMNLRKKIDEEVARRVQETLSKLGINLNQQDAQVASPANSLEKPVV